MAAGSKALPPPKVFSDATYAVFSFTTKVTLGCSGYRMMLVQVHVRTEMMNPDLCTSYYARK